LVRKSRRKPFSAAFLLTILLTSQSALPPSAPDCSKHLSLGHPLGPAFGLDGKYRIQILIHFSQNQYRPGRLFQLPFSHASSQVLSKLFMQVNKPTSYVYESHIIDLLPNMVQSNDLIVFISSSGETGTWGGTWGQVHRPNSSRNVPFQPL
jgi:hypothetical protein